MRGINIYKGNLVFTKSPEAFSVLPGGYIAESDGKVIDVYEKLPEHYSGCDVCDFGNKLLIPGFVDIHLHAPQYENMGIGLDKELLPWLEAYTFPEERKFGNVDYARGVYEQFADSLADCGTLHAVVFGTVHVEATSLLMDLLERKGIAAYVGKVNMDRNAAGYLLEDTDESIAATERWLAAYSDRYARVKPIITPRFTPACSDKLMKALGGLAEKYGLPVQSHLSENRNEIKWVKELVPGAKGYADSYDRCGLFGDMPTIMAHCVHTTDDEIKLMACKNLFVAHCPVSNFDLASGIAPVRKYLRSGVKVGLGSDISGGHSIFLKDAIVAAVQASKMYRVYVDSEAAPLSLSEAFYLATKSGGRFFGKVGSFEPGFEFDMLVIDDTATRGLVNRTIVERLEKFIYNGTRTEIAFRFAGGKKL